MVGRLTMFNAVKIKVKIKLLTKSDIAVPKALLPKSEVFIRLFNKFCRNDAIVNTATKIIIPQILLTSVNLNLTSCLCKYQSHLNIENLRKQQLKVKKDKIFEKLRLFSNPNTEKIS